MKRTLVWRWGCRIRLGNRSIGILGPNDTPLFSERYGYRKPLLRVGRWRLFVDTCEVAR